MIKGKFVNENIPIVKIMVGSDRAIQTPNFILDTGFTGDIQVTKKVAQDLGLEITGIAQTTKNLRLQFLHLSYFCKPL